MKKTLIYLAGAAVLAVGCHRGAGSLQRKDQQQYDVVQEGQASGVTSTINAPGEPTPPPVSMTGTNADTTSNFTLPPLSSTATTTQPPGTIAGTLPPTTSGAIPGYPSDIPPRPRRVRPTPPTDTTSTSLEPPTATSTVNPNTDTAPPPPPEKKDQPKTDTQPPPTTTTT